MRIVARLTRERPTGLFEILDYDSTLELKDIRGRRAVFHRRMKVHFLQDHTIAFQDHAWGDGKVLADYRISPGVVVDQYQESNRWNILISLRETKNKGDTEEFYIDRTVRNGFTKTLEWRQSEIWVSVRHLRLTIVFPNGRWCRRAWIHQRGKDRSAELGADHFHALPDGKRLLVWELNYPKRGEVYTIHWEW